MNVRIPVRWQLSGKLSYKATPWIIVLLTAFLISVLALFSVKLSQFIPVTAKTKSVAAKTKRQRPCPNCSPLADQYIYVPLIDLPEAQSSEIVFNSRSTEEMEVTPTFYKIDGTAIVAEPTHIRAGEIRYVDIKKLIPSNYRKDKDWGGMSLSYYGSRREMWAQLRFLGINGGSNAEEIFTVPQEYKLADIQEAVWWTPKNSEAVIAIGNITDTATSATVQFGNSQIQSVSLAPHATKIIRHKHDTMNENESIVINITGAPGSVVPAGIIESEDGSFNSIVRFYDTKHVDQPNLFANGLRITDITPRMILKNTGSDLITAIPEFIGVKGREDGNVITLPAISLGPNEIVDVDLKPLIHAIKKRKDLDTVSVRVSNKGAPGSLIGSLWSVNNDSDISYDVPLRDSGPSRNMTGVYPWKISDDFTTLVYIT